MVDKILIINAIDYKLIKSLSRRLLFTAWLLNTAEYKVGICVVLVLVVVHLLMIVVVEMMDEAGKIVVNLDVGIKLHSSILRFCYFH